MFWEKSRPTIRRLTVARAFGPPGSGRLTAAGRAVRCALGPSGIAWAKREGDGATPAGRFALRTVAWRADRAARPRCSIAARPLRPSDGWCDDPGSRLYNRPVTTPFSASHEALWRNDGVYDILVTLDHNTRPRIAGRGSAVFLHLARPGFPPTAGCVALAPEAMRRLLPRLARACVLVIR